MNDYTVVTFAIAGIVVIMLLFGICYALFEIAGVLRDLFYLYGGCSDDETD